MFKRYSLIIVTILLMGFFLVAEGQPTKFHWDPFTPAKAESPMHGRRTKIRIDFGPVFQFISNDPHYTNTTSGGGAYTLGVGLEFPIFKEAAIIVGCDFMKESFSFNSYFFAPGYSFLYNGDTYYTHTLSISELQFPIGYKFCFPSETRNARCFYAELAWVWRLFLYNNALVQSTQSGAFVWEGQNDITCLYNVFAPNGCGVIGFSLGYQRNFLRTGNAFFVELQYKYCPSPIIYTGNGNGSNYVQFEHNTFAIKIGLRI